MTHIISWKWGQNYNTIIMYKKTEIVPNIIYLLNFQFKFLHLSP